MSGNGGRKQPDIKVQINDVNVLTELFADADGVVSIELRNAIVQEFAKRHLKELAGDILKEDTRKTVREMVSSAVASKNWNGVTYDTSDPFYKMVKAVVKDVTKEQALELSTKKQEMQDRTNTYIKKLDEKYDKFINLLNNKMIGTLNNWDKDHEERIEKDFTAFKEELRELTKEEVKKANQNFFGSLINGD